MSRDEVARIEALAAIKPRSFILEVGCETGRHAIEFALRGHRVVGIDVAESYLAVAREAAPAAEVDIDFRHRRGVELSETAAYDFILAYKHTLGFMDDQELMQHFSRLRMALKPSGAMLLKAAGPQLVPSKEILDRRNWAEKDGRFILSHHHIEHGYRTQISIVIDTNTEEIVEYHERQRAFSRGDVETMLQSADFTRVITFGDIAGTPATDGQFGVYLCTLD